MSLEMSQDWSSFQRIFHPKKRTKLPESPSSFTAIVQGDKAIRLLPTSDHLPSQGRTQELKSQLPQNVSFREVPANVLEEALDQAMQGQGIFDQLEMIRDSLKRAGVSLPAPLPHFLIHSLTAGWWAKFLPSSYGVLIGLERTQSRPVYHLLIVRKGKVSAFFSPDLSGLSEERASDTNEVVKYLSQKYTLKIQGVVAHYDDWMEWAESESPWKKVSAALRQDRLQFMPFRFRLAALIGTRGYIGV